MSSDSTTLLAQALSNKKINQVAHDEMLKWLTKPEFSEFAEELERQITAQDWPSLLDKFYTVVAFGTGGIRGVMDIGTNRINPYTIRWATQAYAQYLNKHKSDIAQKGVAIAYDSRNNSKHFMQETARVLAANNIPVHIFDYYRSTPELSFTVRHLQLAGGIVVTASHNPPQFNGWKVYDEKGIQVLPEAARLIEREFKNVLTISELDFNKSVADGLIQTIDPDVDEAFIETSAKVAIYPNHTTKIVFSPLHGVGSQNVIPALKLNGFSDIHTVDEQMSLDGNFPTVKDNFPQPEFPVVYEPAISLAKTVTADIVLVSDPDADRLGIAVPDSQGNWHVLTGNQGGVLMQAYYLKQLESLDKMPKNPVIIKTTVTTDLIRDVAETHNVEVVGDLLVGFKFIGDRIERMPDDETFLFGLEESIGYLFGTAYRDKGAETPAVVAAEMAAWCKDNGMTPIDFLEQIYVEHGYYAERLYYRLIEGVGALEQMNLAMKKLRQQLPTEVAGRKIVKSIDRLTGEVKHGQTGEILEVRNWDKGDMLSLFFSDDERNALHLRPSGTEPKMKYYTMVKGNLHSQTKEALDAQAIEIEQDIVTQFERILKTVSVDVF